MEVAVALRFHFIKIYTHLDTDCAYVLDDIAHMHAYRHTGPINQHQSHIEITVNMSNEGNLHYTVALGIDECDDNTNATWGGQVLST